jgi:hypothetical protein
MFKKNSYCDALTEITRHVKAATKGSPEISRSFDTVSVILLEWFYFRNAVKRNVKY